MKASWISAEVAPPFKRRSNTHVKMEKHNSVMVSTIDKGDLVLITGVSGFIASHTANQFLEAGYRVRGTVRSLEKADWLYKLFDEKYGKGKFEASVVPDMMAEDAFNEAVKGVAGICHMASVMSFSDKPDEVIPIVVRSENRRSIYTYAYD